MEICTVKFENNELTYLDQTKLPNDEVYKKAETKEDVWNAIKRLEVRGAPLIGVFAAYGLYISVKDSKATNALDFKKEVEDVASYLDSSRPTAVNLSRELNRTKARMCREIEANPLVSVEYLKAAILDEVKALHQDDVNACLKMGEYGLSLLKPGMGILTHCNAGILATSGYGTCLAPIYLGQDRGYDFKVFSDETRPLLQGARLTSWELSKRGVDVTMICDNMAATVMKKGWIDAVVVGCDRMAMNGDGANKIGTAGVAILAHEFGIPFYMFVPTSTIDRNAKSEDDIPIELRDGEEIKSEWYKKSMGPEAAKTFNPAFDVTNHKYITAVITEKGIVYPPFSENLKKLFEDA